MKGKEGCSMLTAAISYDEKYDILYMRPTPYVPSYADEDDDGIITLRSIEDDSAVGMAVYDFKKRMLNHTLPRNELPFPVDYSDNRIQKILD